MVGIGGAVVVVVVDVVVVDVVVVVVVEVVVDAVVVVSSSVISGSVEALAGSVTAGPVAEATGADDDAADVADPAESDVEHAPSTTVRASRGETRWRTDPMMAGPPLPSGDAWLVTGQRISVSASSPPATRRSTGAPSCRSTRTVVTEQLSRRRMTRRSSPRQRPMTALIATKWENTTVGTVSEATNATTPRRGSTRHASAASGPAR